MLDSKLLSYTNIAAMVEVARRSPVPIATGESFSTKQQFAELLTLDRRIAGTGHVDLALRRRAGERHRILLGEAEIDEPGRIVDLDA